MRREDRKIFLPAHGAVLFAGLAAVPLFRQGKEFRRPLVQNSPMRRLRARKRSFNVTKKLAFKHAGRNSADINGDKWTLGHRTCPMNTLGDKFLACSGFSGNHDRVAASGHNLSIGQNGAHLRTLSNNISKGHAAKYLTDKNGYDFILSIGDDTTDEEMFITLGGNHNAITVRIGSADTQAKFKLNNLIQVKRLLGNLIEDSEVNAAN